MGVEHRRKRRGLGLASIGLFMEFLGDNDLVSFRG